MRKILALVSLICTLLVGCSTIKFADGQRVAIEHEQTDVAALQSQADNACIQSGGKPPAVLISNLPLHDNLPAWMLRKTATYRCQ